MRMSLPFLREWNRDKMRINTRTISRLALATGMCAAPISAAWGQDTASAAVVTDAAAVAARGAQAPASATPAAIDQVSRSEIVVTANSREDLRLSLSPGAVSVIYPDDTRGEHKSLPDLLDQIPGVFVRRINGTGQYTTTSIRGSAPSQVNIYIDGVPHNTSNEAAADISTIPISNVERIEVYRGNVPARFSGSPLGGAINIVTKQADGLGGAISGGVRSFGGWQTSANINVPLFGGNLLVGVDAEGHKGDFKYTHYQFEQKVNLSNGMGEDGLPNTFYSQFNPGSGRNNQRPHYASIERTRLNNSSLRYNGLIRWTNDNFSAKYSYTHMERFIPLSILLYGDETDVPELAYPSMPVYVYRDKLGLAEDELLGIVPEVINPRRRQLQDQHDIALGWHDQFGDLQASASFNFMDRLQNYRNFEPLGTMGLGAFWSRFHTRRIGAQFDLVYTLGESAPISQLVEFHIRGSQETMYADANAIGNSDFYTRFRRHLANIQIQDTITVHPLGGLQITPVGRLEKLFGPVLGSLENPFGPSAGDYKWQGTWGVSAKKEFGGWLIFADTGTYNRYPNFYEIYGDGINVQAGSDSIGRTNQLLREFGRNSNVGIGWNGQVVGDLQASFRTTLFARETNNTITYYSTPVGSKYINSGTTLTRGAEFEGNLILGKKADLQMAAAYQNGRYKTGTYYWFGGSAADALNFVGDNPLYTVNNPRFAANARLNLHFFDGNLTTFADIRHTGLRYLYQGTNLDDGTPEFDGERPLTTLELGAHYEMSNGLALTAGVSDVFNQGPKQTYREGRANYFSYGQDLVELVPGNVRFPQQGRTFYLTVAKNFGPEYKPLRLAGGASGQSESNWTGFYVGGAIGRSWAPVNEQEWLLFDIGNGANNGPDGVFKDRVLGHYLVNSDLSSAGNPYTDMFYAGYDGSGIAEGPNRPDGVRRDRNRETSYGFRFGYDRQIGNWLVGAVAEWTHHGLTDSVTGYGSTTFVDPNVINATTLEEVAAAYSNVANSYSFTRALNSTAAIRVRGGFTLGNTLIYGTGGIARADLEESFSTTDTLHDFVVRGAKKHRYSPQLGGGIETRLFGPLTLGLEYLHARFKGGPTVYATGYDGPADPDLDEAVAGWVGQVSTFQVCRTCTGTDIRRSLDNYSVRSLRVTLGYRF